MTDDERKRVETIELLIQKCNILKSALEGLSNHEQIALLKRLSKEHPELGIKIVVDEQAN
jgi:hypothetical protein